jgi:hypothetical protein
MPEFMEEDAGEDSDQLERTKQGTCRARLAVSDQSPPADDQHERRMHLDFGAGDRADPIRPSHAAASFAFSGNIHPEAGPVRLQTMTRKPNWVRDDSAA